MVNAQHAPVIIRPVDLAEVAGINAGYASLMLNGHRPIPFPVALSAFREWGAKIGPLAELTDADIEKLRATRNAGRVNGPHDSQSASDKWQDQSPNMVNNHEAESHASGRAAAQVAEASPLAGMGTPPSSAPVSGDMPGAAR